MQYPREKDMNIEKINATLSEIFQKIGKVDAEDAHFSYDVDLFDYGYLDSFGVVELLLEIKKEYDLDLSHEDFYQDLRSVKMISEIILKKIGDN